MTWQPIPVLYPDAELEVIDRYQSLLPAAGQTDVLVDRKIPEPSEDEPRPDRMVIFTRDGGGSDGLRDVATMRCRVWDVTDQKATDLARLVVALAPRAVDGTILRVEHRSGPYEVPDGSGHPQRYLLFDFHFRGRAL